MKLTKKLSIIAVLTVVMTMGLNAAVNEDYNVDYTASRKLGRAVSNVLFGVVEVPKTMVEEDNINGSVAAYTTGIFGGLSRFIQREVVGVWEILTFWTPDKEPIIKPEYVWDMPVEEAWRGVDIKPNDHSDHVLHAE